MFPNNDVSPKRFSASKESAESNRWYIWDNERSQTVAINLEKMPAKNLRDTLNGFTQMAIDERIDFIRIIKTLTGLV